MTVKRAARCFFCDLVVADDQATISPYGKVVCLPCVRDVKVRLGLSPWGAGRPG